MTTRVVTNTPGMTTFTAKKTTFDDLTLIKYLILLDRNQRTQNVVKSRHLSSFFLQLIDF